MSALREEGKEDAHADTVDAPITGFVKLRHRVARVGTGRRGETVQVRER
jgi:hypothetical protein